MFWNNMEQKNGIVQEQPLIEVSRKSEQMSLFVILMALFGAINVAIGVYFHFKHPEFYDPVKRE